MKYVGLLLLTPLLAACQLISGPSSAPPAWQSSLPQWSPYVVLQPDDGALAGYHDALTQLTSRRAVTGARIQLFADGRAAPTVNLPGLKSLVPTTEVPTVVDVVLDDVLSTAATNSGLRLVQAYVNGSMSYSAFASQWQALLTSSAQSWAAQNHVDLSKY